MRVPALGVQLLNQPGLLLPLGPSCPAVPSREWQQCGEGSLARQSFPSRGTHCFRKFGSSSFLPLAQLLAAWGLAQPTQALFPSEARTRSLALKYPLCVTSVLIQSLLASPSPILPPLPLLTRLLMFSYIYECLSEPVRYCVALFLGRGDQMSTQSR